MLNATWQRWVEEEYGGRLNLESEAFKAADWLESSPPSRRPKSVKRFWLNWLERAKEQTADKDQNAAAPTRVTAAEYVRMRQGA